MSYLRLRWGDSSSAYDGIKDEIASLRRMEQTLAKLDPEEDQWLYQIGAEKCVKLAEEIDKEAYEIEYPACHCDKCGGFSDPDRFGGYPCNCP